MLQDLLPLLPKEVPALVMIVAIAGTVAGFVLWLGGARFSRSLITLLAVAMGAILGLFIPDWMGWSVDGWATSVGAALVLGISGFALHRMWVGVGLGLVLALWATVAVLLVQKVPSQWVWPHFGAHDSIANWTRALWLCLPDATRGVLPYACGTAMVAGAACAFVWPRGALVLLYSLAGVSLLAGMGTAAMNFARPQWLGLIPTQAAAQLTTLFGLVAFGALFQWRLTPVPKPKPQVQS